MTSCVDNTGKRLWAYMHVHTTGQMLVDLCAQGMRGLSARLEESVQGIVLVCEDQDPRLAHQHPQKLVADEGLPCACKQGRTRTPAHEHTQQGQPSPNSLEAPGSATCGTSKHAALLAAGLGSGNSCPRR